jgi:hypothetical protein
VAFKIIIDQNLIIIDHKFNDEFKSHIIFFKKILGILIGELLVFSQFYVKHDLRKNKIIMASTLVFLGISTKFEVLTPNL